MAYLLRMCSSLVLLTAHSMSTPCNYMSPWPFVTLFTVFACCSMRLWAWRKLKIAFSCCQTVATLRFKLAQSQFYPYVVLHDNQRQLEESDYRLIWMSVYIRNISICVNTIVSNTFSELYDSVSKSFRTESITKLTTTNTRWEATQKGYGGKTH
jgi:hypothetical protein